MKKRIPKFIVGLCALAVGSIGICALLFFYSVMLFSNQWPTLYKIHEEFRLIFSVPFGITVIYATFIIIFIPLCGLVLLGLRASFKKTYITKIQVLFFVLLWIIAVVADSTVAISQVQNIINRIQPFSSNPVTFNVADEIPYTVRYVFRTTLRNEVNAKLGVPKEGYEPYMFIQAFPGLSETDFEGVEASIGFYTLENGQLVHKTDNTKLIHTAAKAITDRGMDRLLANVSLRLGVDLNKNGTLTEIMTALIRADAPSLKPLQP